MFSGIVEATSRVIKVSASDDICHIVVVRPSFFDDIHLGDSVCTNGVCLTVESFDESSMTFCIGQETLKVTGWTVESLLNLELNLERSLKMGDRIHGHFVTGHVDTVGIITKLEKGESWVLSVKVKNFDSNLVWKKGSIALNGTSLTVNEVESSEVSICLIPETIERTVFKNLEVGHELNVEYDSWAKGFVNFQKNYVEAKANEVK